MSRSAKGFCHGLWGAVRISAILMLFTRLPEGVAVARVAIAEEVRRHGVVREGVHDLLDRPFGGGMLGQLKWRTRRRWWASTTSTKRTRQ
jgi:hypothetical protein